VRSAPRISLHGGENGNGKVETISKVSAEDWFSLAKWAKENNHLEPWQRKFAFTLGMHITRGKGVSEKQSPYAVKILEEAMSLGFNISE
jgi:peroxiredoxin